MGSAEFEAAAEALAEKAEEFSAMANAPADAILAYAQTLAKDKAERVLGDILDCIVCDNPDAPGAERTYRIEGDTDALQAALKAAGREK